MIFLFSTSFTIHGSPRRSENSLEILKYLHGTCRYRISISLFVNFSMIFRWEGKGKNVQKRVEFFPQSTKYPPLSTLRSTPSQILRTTRDRTAEHLHRASTRTHACTRSIRLHAYLHRKLLRPKIRRKQQQRYGSLCTHPCTQMRNSCSSRRHTSAPLAKV